MIRPPLRGSLPCLTLLLVACGGAEPAPKRPEPAAPARAAAPQESAPAPRETSSMVDTEPPPESVVQVSLEPFVAGVRPGSRFLLAAHFRIHAGYRIGWRFAGDVGKPTQVTFRAPPGFEVGPAQFPAPSRFAAPGGYVGYGYENETAVFAEVKAPSSLRGDAVHRFDLDATWVACKGRCAGEHTSAFVELETTHGDARAADVERALAPFRARLPDPAAAATVERAWELGERRSTLVLRVKGGTPRDFFPDGSADPAPEKTDIGESEVRFEYDEAPRPGSRPLRGVLVVGVNGTDTAVDVEAPLPGMEGDAAAPGAPKKKAAKAR